MENIQEVEVILPKWAQGSRLDEQEFCRQFLICYPMRYCDGSFYGTDGWVSEGEVRRRIFGLLQNFVRTDIGKKTSKLVEALKLNCAVDHMPLEETRVHCRNGTYNLMDDTLLTRKEPCRFRLPVAFNREAKTPERWLSFLGELLYEEDIETLRQYIGYCLLPVNYAQKMLLIIGNGGEGKSRIGVVLSALFGQCMANGSLAKLEASPFARADLQNRLLMVDDDLRLEALNSTNYIKSIVTAEQPMDLERKGQQSYQARLSCRLMGFGNGHLRSLHDRSYGFFRRQIILTTRPLRKDRVDDPYLAQRIIREELEGVLMWALEGLLCLLGNDMRLYISPRAMENMRCVIAEGNNVPEFLASTGYLRFDPEGAITSRHLYLLYRDWCTDNEVMCLPSKTFSSWMIQNQHSYSISYCNAIPGGSGRLVRGFRGLRAVL